MKTEKYYLRFSTSAILIGLPGGACSRTVSPETFLSSNKMLDIENSPNQSRKKNNGDYKGIFYCGLSIFYLSLNNSLPDNPEF